MESNLATVDLSDYSHLLLMCSIKSQEKFPLWNFYSHVWVIQYACLQLASEYCQVQSFVWVVYYAFSLPVSCHNLLFCEHTDYKPNVKMSVLYS